MKHWLLSIVPLALLATWPQNSQDAGPRLRLRLTGNLGGKLEPCGCASGQLGGLARRAFTLKSDLRYDLLLEGGNLAGGTTPLDALKVFTALEAIGAVEPRYHAIGIGPRDLEQDLARFAEDLQISATPLLAADLQAKPGFSWGVQPFVDQVVRAGQKDAVRARIVSFALTLPESAQAKLTLLAPDAAWTRALAGCGADAFRILLAHGEPKALRELCKLAPRPDLVIGITEAVHEPPTAAEECEGVRIVYPGVWGRFLLDVTLARTAGTTTVTEYRRIELEGSKSAPGAAEDAGIKQLLLRHRDEVKAEGLLGKMAEQRPTRNGARFVGSKACLECHEEAYAAWKQSKHAIAWRTLEEAESGKLKHKGTDQPRYGWPVTHYPDCVNCHVVGYGLQSGFSGLPKTAHLTAVGCESCHGPASYHVERERGDKDWGSKGDLGKCDTALCLHCHDTEQSPGFDYEKRWKAIEHK